ncbi:hypothetical protein LXA47_25000 [Massilia sp. P8910]|uniref:hypothetical protein n=1 Tax=Massilia antarctica TaxID=2765360 RepID=UPI001E593D40|nr:hypothetical protein [Massilia antarctica]MCE3606836.1 hypothetical protein [Massilia antarctica]
MNHTDDGQYNLALSVLNAAMGFCFADVRAGHVKPMPDADAARRLQARFMACYAQRARLASGDGVTLQAIITDVGQRVRGRMLPC